jgi:hypothetical protein
MSATHRLNALKARYDAQRIEALAELDSLFHTTNPISIDDMDLQMEKLTDAINKLSVLNKAFSIAPEKPQDVEGAPQS